MAAPQPIKFDNSQYVPKDIVINIDDDVVSEKMPSLQHSSLSEITESPNLYRQITPKDVKLSFNENLWWRHGGSNRGKADEVLAACGFNKSFRRESELMSVNGNKSRLLDPPEQDGNSKRTMKSGFLGKESEVDDDDPFADDDFPDEFKKMRFSKWAVFQLFCLMLIVAAVICSLTVDFMDKKKLFGLKLWRWGLLLFVLICGRLVSDWGIRLIVFFFELNFMLRKRVLYFVYGLRNAIKNCVWLALVLIFWLCLLVQKVESLTHGRVLNYVTKCWVCLLVGTFIWLVKTILVKALASSFHVSTFFDRIRDALFHQYVIEKLSGPALIKIQQEQEEEEQFMAEIQQLQNAGATVPPELEATVFPRSGKLNAKSHRFLTPQKSFASVKSARFSTVMAKKEDEGITIDHLHRLNQKNISAWNMKRLMSIVRKGTLSTLDEQIQDLTGKDETAVQITSEFQAKLAAKKIFCNIAKAGSKHIYLNDLMRYMRDDEALKTMSLFQGETENKGISRRALKNWVLNAYRERRALALSLNDNKTAVNKLHQIVNIFVGIIILIIWILVLKLASSQLFVLASSQIVLAVFVFGNTCKTTFEGIIFLFVMHPFDIGDRCEVDGVQLVVEEMNILSTIFLRQDNQMITYPNSILATKPISNYYRSPDMGDAIDFCIHISTPVEKIATMKEKITSYIEEKNNHWNPAPLIILRDLEDLNKLKISLWPKHRMNGQNMGERWVRRALLVEEMIKIFRELDIEYHMLPLDVNVRNLPDVNSTRLPSNWTSCATT